MKFIKYVSITGLIVLSGFIILYNQHDKTQPSVSTSVTPQQQTEHVLDTSKNENTLFAPTTQPNNTIVTVKTEYYTLTGTTEEEIREQVRNVGPKSEKGEPFFAYTKWYVQWKYMRKVSATGCSAEQIRVPVDVTYTMPEWNPTTIPSEVLEAKWEAFSNNLQLHEDGHKDIGVRAGEEIYTALVALPEAKTCSQLDTQVENTAQNIFRKYQAEEKQYDVDTKHGETQGAFFK